MPPRSVAQLALAAETPVSTASSASGVAAAAMAASARVAQRVELGAERGEVHDGRRRRRYWALATSAMRANVAASRTQMSARTLRSSATPAAFRPLMSVL